MNGDDLPSRQRLDQALVTRGLVATRSQAESWIRLGKVFINGRAVTKPGTAVDGAARVELKADEQYVSRAGLKLASVSRALGLDFRGKIVLDVGSSTGGFTDYALQHGARKVIAVDIGTSQLHQSLRANPAVELHEQTDIRALAAPAPRPDVVVADISFMSLRDVLPHVAELCKPQTLLVVMVKPQFEAAASRFKHKGVVKNDAMRRAIFKDFEAWAKHYFVIADKADSAVAGAKGNRERFYALRPLPQDSRPVR